MFCVGAGKNDLPVRLAAVQLGSTASSLVFLAPDIVPIHKKQYPTK